MCYKTKSMIYFICLLASILVYYTIEDNSAPTRTQMQLTYVDSGSSIPANTGLRLRNIKE